MLRVSRVLVSVCVGTTSDRAGSSKTSSKVRASGTGKWIMISRRTLIHHSRVARRLRQIGCKVPPNQIKLRGNWEAYREERNMDDRLGINLYVRPRNPT